MKIPPKRDISSVPLRPDLGQMDSHVAQVIRDTKLIKDKTTIRLNAEVPEDLYDLLRQRAFNEKRKISEVVRDMLTQYLR
jgi:excinuclease UvrABC helicase subunit UvrB